MQKRAYSVFAKNLWIDLMIVAAFAMMMWPLSTQMNQELRRQEFKERRSIMVNALDKLSQDLSSLQALLHQSRSNEYFSRLAVIRGGLYPSDYIAIANAQKHVSTIAAANPMVVDILAVFQGPRLVITKGASFHSFEEFQSLYGLEGMECAHVLEKRGFQGRHGFAYEPECTVSSFNLGRTQAAFSYWAPLFPSEMGTAVVLIDGESVRRAFLPDALAPYGSFALYDGERLLFSCTPSGVPLPQRGQGGYESLEIANETSGLSLAFWLPERYFHDTLLGTRRLIVSLVALCLGIGILAAVYAAWRQSLPMRRLLGEFAAHDMGAPASRNEYEWIKASMLAMQSQQSGVLEKLKQYQDTLRSLSIERLVNQGALTKEQLALAKKSIGPFPDRFLLGYAMVAGGPLESDQGEDMWAMLAQRALSECLPPETIVHTLSPCAFALIVPWLEGDERPDQAPGDSWRRRLEEDGRRPTISVSFSDPARGMGRVNAAFEQAKFRSAQRWAAAGPCQAQGLNSQSLEKLRQSIEAADEETALNMLHSLMYRGAPAQTDMEQRYYAIRMAILLAAEALEQTAELEKYRADMSPEALEARLQAAVKLLCAASEKRRKERDGKRREEMLGYVREHYGDSALCPADLAERFDVSERYIFTFFKEHTGFSPASYIQKVRMERAAELVRATALTVQAIGEKCGFTSFNTFYKAFKRTYGVTPSKYREL